MAQEIIAELHDALKLTVLKHDFSDFDKFAAYIPQTMSWRGIFQHHCQKDFPAYPTDVETFLLHMADGLAANFSRHRYQEKGFYFSVYKLWQGRLIGEDPRLKKSDEIQELLIYLNTDPTFTDFDEKYGEILKRRAEDANAGCNITSLYTHLVLTGKFYRLLSKSNILRCESNEIGVTRESISKLVDSKKKTWALNLALIKISFNQNPIRARDINILELLSELSKKVIRDYNDYVLFSTSEEILICYDDPIILETITSIFTSKYLWLTNRCVNRIIEEIKTPDPSKISGNRSSTIYPTLVDSIPPPICEICQMRPADKIWPTDYISMRQEDDNTLKGPIENLCSVCFDIRSRPSRLKKLKEWTEDENINVIWVKISLDYEKLIDSLKTLYKNYLNTFRGDVVDKEPEIRFSLVLEFQYDYEIFLKKLTQQVINVFGQDNVEVVLDEMFCIKMVDKSNILKLLEIINDSLNIFCVLKDGGNSPIKINLTYCRSKYPFFSIWKNIKKQSTDLQIASMGHGAVNTSIKFLDQIVMLCDRNYRKSSLTKLAEIAKISEHLAQLKFDDTTDRKDYGTYTTLERDLLPLGMNFQEILTFAKMLGE